MDPFYALLMFFAGEDYWGLNVYVVVALEIVLCHSFAFQIAHDMKREKIKRLIPGPVVWFVIKASIVGMLAFISIKLAIGIGIYLFLSVGLASIRLAFWSERIIWKSLHGIAGVFLLFLVPAALFTAGLLLGLYFEVLFGVGGCVILLIANVGPLVKRRRKGETTRAVTLAIIKSVGQSPRLEKVAVIAGIFVLAMGFVDVQITGLAVDDVMITMRDGTRLATTVYRPTQPIGGLPTILIRTPYNKVLIADWGASWYGKGYAVVIQDVRGTYGSEGTFDALVSSGDDAFDTCTWIANQPWSNGHIGTAGGSALGITQYTAAGAGAPGIMAQSIEVATADLYDTFFRGGKYADCDIGTWIRLNSGGSNATIDTFLAHPIKDTWWNNASLPLRGGFANVSARAVHVSGWFDVFQQNTIDAFMGYYYNGTERARGHQKLIVGPWGHAWGSDIAGQTMFPGGKENPASRWEDAILVESLEPPKLTNGLLSVPSLWNEPNVAYYVMGDVLNSNSGANEWRYADDWPIAHVDTPLYLNGNGTLAWSTPVTSTNHSFLYDPLHPMQTIGGTNLVFDNNLAYDPTKAQPVSIGWGTWDQYPLLNRSDLLVFNSSVLTSPVEVTGNVKVKFWISSNCTDTDFVAKLCDVYPDDRSMLVVDGISSVRKRNGLDKDELIVPGNVYEIEVDLWSTAYQFNAGHRIQLLVSSSNAPKYQPCPNTGVPIARTYASNVIANNTIHLGNVFTSCVVLPISG